MNEKPRVMIAAPAVIDEQIVMLERAGCEILVAEDPRETGNSQIIRRYSPHPPKNAVNAPASSRLRRILR